jgi:phosphinothricin acetyltransferase
MIEEMDAGEIRVRLAIEADLAAISSIYNYYVVNSTCTFQTEPDTAEERMRWFSAHDSRHPVTVAANQSEVVGWASLSRYHSRNAYRHTTEDSVYVRSDMRGRGIGRTLLADLIQRAEAEGYHSIVATIAADQADSIRLHKRFGFLTVGHIVEAGYKFDKWIDVTFMQKMLCNRKQE